MAGENKKRFEAGARLKEIRTAKEWDQKTVWLDSIRRFGKENAIATAQLSRIERGQFDRVTLDDAVRLGIIYGMTPNEIATLFGLWNEPEKKENQLGTLEALLNTLPEDLKVALLWQIKANMAIMRSEYLKRVRGITDPEEIVLG